MHNQEPRDKRTNGIRAPSLSAELSADAYADSGEPALAPTFLIETAT
jgi:hypothetical protein